MQDISNMKFGRLKAQWPSGIQEKSVVAWLCLCTCGNIKNIVTGSLISGQSKSCGCLQKELISKRSFKHGHSAGPKTERKISSEYRAWQGMLNRCLNSNCPKWRYWGGLE